MDASGATLADDSVAWPRALSAGASSAVAAGPRADEDDGSATDAVAGGRMAPRSSGRTGDVAAAVPRRIARVTPPAPSAMATSTAPATKPARARERRGGAIDGFGRSSSVSAHDTEVPPVITIRPDDDG